MNTQVEHVTTWKKSWGAFQLRMHRDDVKLWPEICRKLGKSEEEEIAFVRDYFQLRYDSVHYEAVFRAACVRMEELDVEYWAIAAECMQFDVELPGRLAKCVGVDRDVTIVSSYLAFQRLDFRTRKTKCCSSIDEQTVWWRHNRTLANDADNAADKMLDDYDQALTQHDVCSV